MSNPEEDLLGENLRRALRASEDGIESSCRDFLARVDGRKARPVPRGAVTLAASLLLCAGVFAYVLFRPDPSADLTPLQEKKSAATPESLEAEVARLEKALDSAKDDEERERIRVSADDLRRKLGRVKAGKPTEDPPVKMKKPDFTLEKLNAEIKMNPGKAAAYVARAAEYLNRKGWPEALADADRALALDSDDPQAHFLRGKALYLLERRAESDEAFARATKLRPELEAAVKEVRSAPPLAVKKKKIEPADERSQKVQKELDAVYAQMKMAKKPGEIDRLKARAEELGQELKLLSQGKGQLDIKAIELRLQANPDDVEALVDRASWHLQNAKAEPALKDLDRALELKPDCARAYLKRAMAHALREDFTRAREDVRRGENLDRTLAQEIYDAQVWIKKLQGAKQQRPTPAAEVLQQIQALKDRLEEVRGQPEAGKVQAEIDRLTAELKARPPETKVEKKKKGEP